jgi:hypothetical protein
MKPAINAATQTATNLTIMKSMNRESINGE